MLKTHEAQERIIFERALQNLIGKKTEELEVGEASVLLQHILETALQEVPNGLMSVDQLEHTLSGILNQRVQTSNNCRGFVTRFSFAVERQGVSDRYKITFHAHMDMENTQKLPAVLEVPGTYIRSVQAVR